jgi:hypothetical protein
MLTKKELKDKLIKMGIRIENDKITKSSIIAALTKIVGKRKSAIKADPVEGYYKDILTGYLEAMLWAEMDDEGNPLDDKYAIIDVSDEVVKKSLEEIKQFCKKAEDAGVELTQYDTETIGHDLLLTRNGHGAGFWDGDYEDNDGEILTEISKTFRELHPYVGDDGKVYVE